MRPPVFARRPRCARPINQPAMLKLTLPVGDASPSSPAKEIPNLEGIPNLIEHLGEYALVHCETSSGNQFIVKTTDLDKISKGTLSGFYVDVDDTYSFDSAS